jgi:hypothetical protein
MKTNINTLSDAAFTKPLYKGGWFLIALWLFFGNCAYSQDIITLKNGTEIKAKILELSDHTILYKKFEEQTAEAKYMLKSDIFMIKYENGTKEVFESKSAPVYVVTPAPATPPTPPKFDPDTSDFAKIRKKKFSGPRVGVTYISPGTSADYLEERGKNPVVTQFGWQFEARLFTVDETSGIFEFVPMIGGLEQGMFIPSASALLGVRTGKKFTIEFAIGPNFSVVPDYYGHKKGFAGLVIALGTSLKKGNIHFPITLAYVPSVGNVTEVYDPVTGRTDKVTYHTGSRISLIAGFNSTKK